MATQLSTVELFEQQKKRHAELQNKRARAEAVRDAERQNLERTRAEARKLLGTDNVDELRKLYQQGEADNERKTTELVFALDEVQRTLDDIERMISTR